MSTDYYHTHSSARDTIRKYRDGNAFDTFAEAIADMQACVDDLDDEDKSALRYAERHTDLLESLVNKPHKYIKSWCMLVQWSDGTTEERVPSLNSDDLEQCLSEWESEANK
jgi:hypothetical protein